MATASLPAGESEASHAALGIVCSSLPAALLYLRVEKLWFLLAFPVKMLALTGGSLPDVGGNGSSVDLHTTK